ncbi:hypothetical protein [Seleniivibrio woodruffii]|uniref:Helix-turn-helix protein n=1 Tax=Seleniivibrio woodruffii TaxID=1078050 RepID=A0A4R1K3A1_9BACT|nr:hypothetical protein [Seleniivibrio woodruffii]TCK58370.1 hypothetical protein C8D98_2571 [Seleniivibrio woodruffii]TVZ36744.1 hypothetical protein OF66_2381 [Seleniivibrio woodruffii]
MNILFLRIVHIIMRKHNSYIDRKFFELSHQLIAEITNQQKFSRIDATFSIEETAALLHTTPANLAKWRCIGRGPRYRKDGGNVFYTAKDLQTYLNRIASKKPKY